MKLKPLAALAMVATVCATGPASAETLAKAPKTYCAAVETTGTGTTTQTSPTTAITTAIITARRGLPVGTTIGTFTISGAPPVVDLGGPVAFTAKSASSQSGR